MKLNKIFKPFAAFCAAIALTVTLTSCGDSHQDLVDEACDIMKDMASEVNDIKDADSAKAAEESLNGLVEQMKDLAERAKELDDPSPEVQKELDKQMEDAAKEFQKAMTDVASDPARAQLVMPIMLKIGKKMEAIDFGPKK